MVSVEINHLHYLAQALWANKFMEPIRFLFFDQHSVDLTIGVSSSTVKDPLTACRFARIWLISQEIGPNPSKSSSAVLGRPPSEEE